LKAKVWPNITHHILSTLIPLIAVKEPETVEVCNSFFVLVIREKEIRIFLRMALSVEYVVGYIRPHLCFQLYYDWYVYDVS
jgi:hypothetical protein